MITKRYFFLISCLAIIYSCKKATTEPPLSSGELTASFAITKQCYFLSAFDTLQHLDTSLIFSNKSNFKLGTDTNQTKSYKWDFGDNTESTEISPAHTYYKPGLYKVTLFTFLNKQPSDTLTRNLRIIIGQKEFKANTLHTQTIDLDRTADNGILMLVSNFNSYSDIPSYNLIKADSLLKLKWMKPIAGLNVRLSSIKKTAGSDYILSGNYTAGNTDLFSISKIDSDANLLWTKSIASIQGKNNFTIPTSDGGFLTIGNSTLTSSYYTVVVKFDANGNELWHKNFNGTKLLRDAENIIETSTGYVFASIVRGFSDHELVITKLDLSGNILQQSSTFTGNSNSIYTAGIAYAANVYLVYTTNATIVYLFDNNLSFTAKRTVAQTGINEVNTRDNLFYLAEGSHQYSYIRQLSLTGIENWSGSIDNRLNLSCSGIMYGLTRYCRKVLCAGSGDIIAFSYGENSPSGFNSSSVYVEKFNANGVLK